MNSRRLRAQRLPGACCKPFPPSPQLYPVKSPSVSSRAGNRRSYLLPKQPCSICPSCGILPEAGAAPKLSTLSCLSVPELPLQRCPGNICPWCRTLLTGHVRGQHLFWPEKLTGVRVSNFPCWAFGDVICCTLIP